MTDRFWLRATELPDGRTAVTVFDSPDLAPANCVDDWTVNVYFELWSTIVEHGYGYARFLGKGVWEVNRIPSSVAPVFPESDLEYLHRRLNRVEQALGLDPIDRK